MKLYFEKRVLLIFLSVISALLFLVFYSFTKIEQVKKTARMLLHSYDVINSAEQLIKACLDLETGQRGYVLTNNPIFLEPYRDGKKEILPRLKRLDSLAIHNPSQQEQLKSIHKLITKQLVYTEEVVQTNERNNEAARNLIASGNGKERTDSLRILITQIQLTEKTIFLRNSAVTNTSLYQFQFSFTGLVITILVLSICLFYILNKILGQRKQIEQQLTQAVNETRLLYDTAPCGYLSVDASIHLSNINMTLLNWLGYTHNEVIGKLKYEDLLSPDSKEKFVHSFQEDFEKYKQEGYISDLEFDFKRKDGSTFPVLVNSSAAFNEQGDFVSSRTTVFDNSARKKIQDKFKDLLEAAPDALIVVNETGTIEMVNDQCQNVFGFSRKELIGQPVEILMPERYRQNHLLHRSQYFANPTVRPMGIGLELFGIRKNGEEFPIEISLSPIRADAGLLISASIRDISDRKNSEKTIKKLNKELEAFTYSVSHDLRAPLRSVSGYAQILKEDYSDKVDEEGRRVIDIIIENGKRMGQLIDDLLDFSRMGRKELMKNTVNMDKLVKEAINDLMTERDPQRIQINTQTILSTKADIAMLKQVWTNLISNALKYSSKKNTAVIEIGSSQKNGNICYFIKDNGAGFDMQYVGKLFGVFQRLHKMNEFDGTGVGLALVKTIVTRHGGEVWAEGKLNEGATFYFTLPKA